MEAHVGVLAKHFGYVSRIHILI